jgi:hypothetical protein
MKLYKDKRAAERYLSPWMFLIWAMIGVAVVAGVLIFNSAKIDVREKEADILVVRIIDCLVDNGYLIKDLDSFDIFEECNLDKEIIENGDYWFNISFSDDKLKDISAGVKNFEMLCELGEELKAENFPKCSEEKIYVLKDGEKIGIEILAASNQLGGDL